MNPLRTAPSICWVASATPATFAPSLDSAIKETL